MRLLLSGRASDELPLFSQSLLSGSEVHDSIDALSASRIGSCVFTYQRHGGVSGGLTPGTVCKLVQRASERYGKDAVIQMIDLG